MLKALKNRDIRLIALGFIVLIVNVAILIAQLT